MLVVSDASEGGPGLLKPNTDGSGPAREKARGGGGAPGLPTPSTSAGGPERAELRAGGGGSVFEASETGVIGPRLVAAWTGNAPLRARDSRLVAP